MQELSKISVSGKLPARTVRGERPWFHAFRLGLALAVSLLASTALAQTATTRYQQNIVGGASMFGNSWFTSATGAQPVTIPDVDNSTPLGPSSTHSTYSDLILPAGSTIVKAYLYAEMGTYNSGHPLMMSSLKFAAPGDSSYTTLNAASPGFLVARNVTGNYNQLAWDVTSLINPSAYSTSATGGAAGRFFVADPSPLPGLNPALELPMGGWSIIVVYSNPNSKARNITIADTWTSYQSSSISFDIPNVSVPAVGPVRAVVGMTGTYGDRGYADILYFGQAGFGLTALTDPRTGATSDAMNSSIAWTSTNNVSADGGPALSGNQTTRSPISTFAAFGATAESWEYDSDIFGATGTLPNSATPITARVFATSTGGGLGVDVLVAGAFFASIDIVTPKLTKALSPTTINSGGVATYTWTLDHTAAGGTTMSAVGFTDTLPSGIKIATPNGASTTCTGIGSSLTATADSQVVTLSNVTLLTGTSCTVTVNVTNVVGQSNASCATNPAAFTNSAANITASSNVTNALAPVCLVVPGSSITIIKDAQPNDAQDFAFTATGTGLSAFSLDDDADATVLNTKTFTGLAAGSYTVTESALAGWNLTGLTCVDPDSGTTIDLATRTATIDLDAGEDVICTYTNAKAPIVRLQKILPSGRFAAADQFALNINGANGPATVTTTGTGNTVTGQAVLITTAEAGNTVTLSETAAAGTNLANYTVTYSCTNALAGGQSPSGTGSSFAITTMAPGDDLTCTFSNTVQAAPNFGTCDSRLWLSQVLGGTAVHTTLFQVDTNTNPLTYNPTGDALLSYNALGYNPADNYMYSMLTGGSNNLLRIGADGSAVNLGAVTGLPIATYSIGSFGTAGNIFYVKDNVIAGTTFYAIDVTTMTATPVTMTASFNIGDWAWINGLLYAVTGQGQLASINPTTGQVINIGPINGITGGTVIGVMYGAPNGLYGTMNNGGGFYKFDLLTGAATRISNAPGSGNNDGTNCPAANIVFGADLQVTKTNTPGVNGNVDQANDNYTPGAVRSYTVVVTNAGPFGAANTVFTDPAIANFTVSSVTCGTPTGGAVCPTAANTTAALMQGSGIVIPSLPFSGTTASSVTFTVTGTIADGASGALTNVATTAVGTGSNDPTPANNSATDSDRGPLVDLSLTKTNTPGTNGELDQASDTLVPGQTTTYTLVVTNNGPDAADGAVLRDPAANRSGLTCTAPPTCTASGGAVCPAIALVQLDSGVTLPTLPNGGAVTVSLSCTVQ